MLPKEVVEEGRPRTFKQNNLGFTKRRGSKNSHRANELPVGKTNRAEPLASRPPEAKSRSPTQETPYQRSLSTGPCRALFCRARKSPWGTRTPLPPLRLQAFGPVRSFFFCVRPPDPAKEQLKPEPRPAGRVREVPRTPLSVAANFRGPGRVSGGGRARVPRPVRQFVRRVKNSGVRGPSASGLGRGERRLPRRPARPGAPRSWGAIRGEARGPLGVPAPAPARLPARPGPEGGAAHRAGWSPGREEAR